MDVFFKIQTLFLDWICYWPFSGKALIYMSMQNAHTVYPESWNRYLVCNYCAYGYFGLWVWTEKMDSHFWIDVFVYFKYEWPWPSIFWNRIQTQTRGSCLELIIILYYILAECRYLSYFYINFFHDRLTKPNKENFCRTFRALNLV